MKIRVRAAGMAAKQLPGRPPGGKLEMTLPDGASVATLVSTLGLSSDRHWLTSVNASIVAPDAWAATALADGDEVAILPPIKGG